MLQTCRFILMDEYYFDSIWQYGLDKNKPKRMPNKEISLVFASFAREVQMYECVGQ